MHTEPAEAVDLKEMLSAFTEDEATAKKAYVGKRIHVKGWAGAFDTDGIPYGKPVSLFLTPAEFDDRGDWITNAYVTCRLRHNKPWEHFNVGDPVEVEGTLAHEFGPFLADCTVIAPQGTPAPTLTIEKLVAEAEADFKAAEEKYDGLWINVTGKVIERARVEETDLSNILLILYQSDKLQVAAEYSSLGSDPLKNVAVGDTITIGDEVTFLFITDRQSFIHFSMPYLHPKQ